MQLDYNDMPPYRAGAIADTSNRRWVATERMPTLGGSFKFGVGVTYTPDGKQIGLPGVDSDVIRGVVVENIKSALEDQIYVFSEKDIVPVLERGPICVIVDQDVVAGDPVYCRFSYVSQIIKITFSADFVASNSIAVTIGENELDPVVFNTNNATTYNDLALEIETLSDIVEDVTYDAGTREMFIFFSTGAEDPLHDYVNEITVEVTLGVSQATATIEEEQAPSDSTELGCFRKDDNDTGAGPTALLVPRARFKQSSENDLAPIQFN